MPLGRFQALEKVVASPRWQPLVQRPSKRWLLLALPVCIFLVAWLSSGSSKTVSGLDRAKVLGLYDSWKGSKPSRTPPVPRDNWRYSATIVAGYLAAKPEEVDWVQRLNDVERKMLYTVDDTSTPLHLDQNHGRESMVYLQYILDHYDNLTDITFFMHAHRYAWHNNVIMKRDSLATLNLLKRSYVSSQGYVNTRCDSYPGCPRMFRFAPTEAEGRQHGMRWETNFFAERWNRLFPDVEELPDYLAAPCCSQFAVTREAIRAVPLETYQRVHDWVREMPYDGVSGRFMEYAWHYIFTKKEELCPDTAQCYCDMYDICDVEHHVADKWQSSKARAEELGDLAGLIMDEYKAKPNKSVEKDPEYQSLRARQKATEDVSDKYLYLMDNKFGIEPID